MKCRKYYITVYLFIYNIIILNPNYISKQILPYTKHKVYTPNFKDKNNSIFSKNKIEAYYLNAKTINKMCIQYKYLTKNS